jgi:hypothetical protein
VVQTIKTLFLTFFIFSCATNSYKPLPDSEKVKQIKNTYWQSDKEEEKRTFKDGQYEVETKIEGESCASCIEKASMGEIVLGSLSNSEDKEAVSIIYSETGGSGTYVYLNLYVNKNGKMVQSGFPIFLGDREKVEKVTIKNKNIILEMITHGKGEPLCCPTTKEIRIFKVENGSLKKVIK